MPSDTVYNINEIDNFGFYILGHTYYYEEYHEFSSPKDYTKESTNYKLNYDEFFEHWKQGKLINWHFYPDNIYPLQCYLKVKLDYNNKTYETDDHRTYIVTSIEVERVDCWKYRNKTTTQRIERERVLEEVKGFCCQRYCDFKEYPGFYKQVYCMPEVSDNISLRELRKSLKLLGLQYLSKRSKVETLEGYKKTQIENCKEKARQKLYSLTNETPKTLENLTYDPDQQRYYNADDYGGFPSHW